MPTIKFKGQTYFYEDCGEGVPLLLLHGFPFDSSSWWPLLEAPPKGIRLLVPDHRGFGKSDLPPGISTMDAMAEDALSLLEALKLPSAWVCGLSMGGYVAIALLRSRPDRVRGLILVDTQSLADDEPTRARRETTAVQVEAEGVDTLVQGMLGRLFGQNASQETRRRVEMMMRRQTPQGVAAASRGMAARADGKDILSRYSGPCLVVVGEADIITPVERAKTMCALVSNARLEIVPDAGHLVPLEQPEAFRSLLVSVVR